MNVGFAVEGAGVVLGTGVVGASLGGTVVGY
jgi:hypothetical protein